MKVTGMFLIKSERRVTKVPEKCSVRGEHCGRTYRPGQEELPEGLDVDLRGG